MVNKIRFVSLGGASTLVLATGWAIVHYGPTVGYAAFLLPLATALAVATLPWVLARAKLWIYNARQWWENRESYSFERGTMFQSLETVGERTALLDDVAVALKDTDGYDEVRRDEFPEGKGLTVLHAGFHNTFLRITEGDRVVITGASRKSRDFARLLEEQFGLTMEQTWLNPLLRSRPVRGAPRVFLGIFLVALLVGGTNALGAAAYPTTAYNSAEKAVLVGLDARGDMPGIDENDVRLQKAAFIVGIMKEEAVEIRWEKNSSDRIMTHAQEAMFASEQAEQLLNTIIEEGDTTQRQQARKIEADRQEAERKVAEAIAYRNEGNVSSEDLTHMRRTLQNRSAGSTYTPVTVNLTGTWTERTFECMSSLFLSTRC